jgi:hypothetical protein
MTLVEVGAQCQRLGSALYPGQPDGGFCAYGSNGMRPVSDVAERVLQYKPGALQGTKGDSQRRCREWPEEMRDSATFQMLVSASGVVGDWMGNFGVDKI